MNISQFSKKSTAYDFIFAFVVCIINRQPDLFRLKTIFKIPKLSYCQQISPNFQHRMKVLN